MFAALPFRRLALIAGLCLGAGPLARAQQPAPATTVRIIPGATVVPPGVAPAPAPAPASAAVAPKPAPQAEAASPAAPARAARQRPVVKRAPPVAPKPGETALSTSDEPSLAPQTFFTTAKMAERYAAIVEAGGWPTIGAALQPGASGPDVRILRNRLAIEGDLEAGAAGGEDWDETLGAAVRRFQSRHGLKQTGAVAGATLKAINVTAMARQRQLAASAHRLADREFAFPDRYVVVNIPSASVEAIADGKVARRYVAVAGDVKHPSPEVEARIGAVNLNPTWTVPTSIIRNEIIPHMRRNPNYLARARIRVLDSAGQVVDPMAVNWRTEHAVNFTLRQDSGAGNSLGAIRIAMPNKHSVYMHDTPSKRLFGADYRFQSHGCVRVADVLDLAEWLLAGVNGPAGGWSKAALAARIATGAREDIRLPQPVPVYWVYLTGWADADGRAHFRPDVYGQDTIGVAGAPASKQLTATR